MLNRGERSSVIVEVKVELEGENEEEAALEEGGEVNIG